MRGWIGGSFCLLIALSLSFAARAVEISTFHPDIYKPLKFSAKKDWLSREVPYPPVARIGEKIHRAENITLKNRGEAHITVITPPEFEKLREYISIGDINSIALKNKIESSEFKTICLGEGRKDELRTFFIVVTSDALMNIRQQIAKFFREKGGRREDFDPTHFYPHITVGFTERDLHEADGVIKNRAACAKQP